MNWILEVIPESILEALGWTFIDSLWQGLFISATILVFILLFRIKSANTKYWLQVIGMVLIFAGALASFVYHSNTAQNVNPEQAVSGDYSLQLFSYISQSKGLTASYQHWVNAIEPFFPWLVSFWMLGAIVFTFRLIGGFYYVQRLKAMAIPINDGMWLSKFEKLKQRIGIDKAILFLESSRINVPMVAGHLKPILLIPIGILTNMSPNQVEALLLHELSHIQRHDYLVNIIQSVLEVVLFFNPAVWYISAQLRKEREHCCDDMALSCGVNSLEYVRALTTIQEQIINKNSIAMALANNNNQLLLRIKRLLGRVDTSQSYSWHRLFIIVLLTAGLFGFSWITNSERNEQSNENEIAKASIFKFDHLKALPGIYPFEADTIVTGSEDESINEDEKHDVWRDKEGNVIEYTDEYADSYDFDIDVVIPDIDVPTIIFDLPELAELSVVPDVNVIIDEVFERMEEDFMQSFDFHWSDTIPLDESREVEIREQVEREMKQVFEEHHKVMKEMRKSMDHLHSMNFDKMNKEKRKANQERMEKMQNRMHLLQREMENDQRHRMEKREKFMREREFRTHRQEFSLREAEDHIKKAEQEIALQQEKIKELEKNIKSYEKELVQELRKDGYLKNNEDLNNFSIHGNDRMEVNGKPIKEEHIKKYEDLRRKYLDNE